MLGFRENQNVRKYVEDNAKIRNKNRVHDP